MVRRNLFGGQFRVLQFVERLLLKSDGKRLCRPCAAARLIIPTTVLLSVPPLRKAPAWFEERLLASEPLPSPFDNLLQFLRLSRFSLQSSSAP